MRLKIGPINEYIGSGHFENQFQVSELELGGHPRSIKTRLRLENDPKTDVSFRRGDVT